MVTLGIVRYMDNILVLVHRKHPCVEGNVSQHTHNGIIDLPLTEYIWRLCLSLYRELIVPSEEHRYCLAKELRVDQRNVIDFSLPVNPLGVSKKIRAEMRKYLKDLKHFPDPDCVRLRGHIARYHKVAANNIFCTAGGAEALRAMQRSVGAKNVLLLSPYQNAVGAMITSWGHVSLETVALDSHDGYRFNSAKFTEAMEGCDIAFLQTPHFPTGTVIGREEILALSREAEKRNCYLVVDESLNGFVSDKSVADAVPGAPFLAVIRTFSFYHALAGLGVAYIVCSEGLSRDVQKKRTTPPPDLLGQRAAVVALRDRAYVTETEKIVKEEKAILEKSFEKLGLTFTGSSGNWYLLHSAAGQDLIKFLARGALLCGNGEDYTGLGGEDLVVSVKGRRENAALIRALNKFPRR